MPKTEFEAKTNEDQVKAAIKAVLTSERATHASAVLIKLLQFGPQKTASILWFAQAEAKFANKCVTKPP